MCVEKQASSFIFQTPRPHFAEGIWKRSFSLRLGLPSTLIRHEYEALPKRSLNRRNWKMPALHYNVNWKHFENGAIRNNGIRKIQCDFPAEFSQTTIPKWKTSSVVCVFRVGILCFQIPPPWRAWDLRRYLTNVNVCIQRNSYHRGESLFKIAHRHLDCPTLIFHAVGSHQDGSGSI